MEKKGALYKIKDLNVLGQYLSLPRNVYILFVAKTANSLGTLVFSFLTLYLTGKLSISEDIAGIYVTMASLAFAPGSLLGGKLSDLVNRKYIYIVFQGAAGICFFLCAFFDNSLLVPWLLIFAQLFVAGAQTANSAMVMDETTAENRKQAFSLLFLGTNVGIGVGALLVGFMFKNHIKLLFLGCSIAIFVAIVIVAVFIKESIPLEGEKEAKYEKNPAEDKANLSVIKLILQKPILIAFALVCVVYSFVHSQYSFSLPLQVNAAFDTKGPEIYGTLMTVNSLTIIVMTAFITSLTLKSKTLTNIIRAGGFFAVGFGMVALADNIWLMIISTIIWSTGEILYNTNSNVYIADNTTEAFRGRLSAIFTIVSSSGFAISPVFMGFFIRWQGINKVWPLLFVLSVIAMLLMSLINLKENRSIKKIR